MADFVKPSTGDVFGKHEFLRSTQDVKTESYTAAKDGALTYTIDGVARKILQPGTVMAKITSGADTGKVAPFQAGVADGTEDVANIVGLAISFVPWQFEERDVTISVTYECAAIQAWCVEHDGTDFVVLGDTTAAAMVAKKNLDIRFP